MNYALPIGLLLLSFLLIVIEIFVPSFGAISLLAVASLVGSIVLAFAESETFGWALIGTSAVGIPVLLVISFKVFPSTPLGKHMILGAPKRHPEPATRSNRTDLVGREGIARSQLRPSGTADLDGERVDVVTRGELVDAGSRIRVIENRGNRIVVKAIETKSKETDEEELR
jgi:membrane-bound serine protease (ClpP class)